VVLNLLSCALVWSREVHERGGATRGEKAFAEKHERRNGSSRKLMGMGSKSGGYHDKPSYPGYGDGNGDSSSDGGDGGDYYPGGEDSDDDGEWSPVGDCNSAVASAIQQVPEATTLNPTNCCDFDGPVMVFVTHALSDPSTITGFEQFWNDQYLEFASTSEMSGVCFVMSGYNQTVQSDKSLNDVLIEVNQLVSQIPTVTSMMSTDPTEELNLVDLFRTISDTPDGPNIGVFNAGLKNVETESLVSGQSKLPYVGYTDDAQYGSEAASMTLRMLQGEPATPLCFNGRPQLTYVGRRCAAYYNDVTDDPPSRLFGVSCRSDSNVNAIVSLIVSSDANAVYSQIDCCTPVAQAAAMAQEMLNRTIIVGCQDEDTSGGLANFVTGQPIGLQAYQTASWATLPVLESLAGGNGRSDHNFPDLSSLLNTEIYTSLVF